MLLTKFLGLFILFMFVFVECSYIPDDTLELNNPPIKNSISEPVEIFHVDKMPEFPGGYQQLKNYIATNFKYPQKYFESDISGTVYISLVINIDGSVGEAQITKGVEKEIDEEALCVIKKMPKWKPAMIKGKIVRCSMIIPVRIYLE